MSKHCRILALILSLTTLFCALPALGDGLPEAFSVTYKTEDRFVNHKRGFVSKEHIAAANPAVASEINALVDAYDEQYAPALKGSDNPKRNSRLDIHVVHSVTGTKWVSFLVLARQSYARKQLSSPFTARAATTTLRGVGEGLAGVRVLEGDGRRSTVAAGLPVGAVVAVDEEVVATPANRDEVH